MSRWAYTIGDPLKSEDPLEVGGGSAGIRVKDYCSRSKACRIKVVTDAQITELPIHYHYCHIAQ